ncbi:hypothetical protein WJX73_007538 [Symbiochloris irregularis]|uniref:Uncharacterized protein n=1 Tax=Symbiochloris irregularis TaxID=706552 RepID=A0AAW1NXN1_9CHLO
MDGASSPTGGPGAVGRACISPPPEVAVKDPRRTRLEAVLQAACDLTLAEGYRPLTDEQIEGGAAELKSRLECLRQDGSAGKPVLLASRVSTTVLERFTEQSSGIHAVRDLHADRWTVFFWKDPSITHALTVGSLLELFVISFASAGNLRRTLLTLAGITLQLTTRNGRVIRKAPDGGWRYCKPEVHPSPPDQSGQLMFEVAVHNEDDALLLEVLEMLLATSRTKVAIGLKVREERDADDALPQLTFAPKQDCQLSLSKVPTTILMKGTEDAELAPAHPAAVLDLYELREKIFFQLDKDPSLLHQTPANAEDVAQLAAAWASTSSGHWWGSDRSIRALESSSNPPQVIAGQ